MPLSGAGPTLSLMPHNVAYEELVFSGSPITRRSFQRGSARSDQVFGIGSPFKARLFTMITITCALVPTHRSPGPLNAGWSPAASPDRYGAKYSRYTPSARKPPDQKMSAFG